MKIPTIRGLIDRRLLINFRVAAEVLDRHCPAPFRPQLVDGFGMAGICLIRLKQIRPAWMPFAIGLASENAAHRIAVQWDTPDGEKSGVYIPRRDTSSRLNAIAGGRVFPGQHHLANFNVEENGGRYRLEMNSFDDSAQVLVEGQVAERLPESSVFDSVGECSRFFEDGSLGYSATSASGHFDGLELRSNNWHVEPLDLVKVESYFFDDEKLFPRGSVVFDNALLMRRIDHEWHSRDPICCANAGTQGQS